MNKLLLIFGILVLHVQTSLAQRADDRYNISPLLISERIPSVNLKTVDGQSVSIDKLLSEKPSVIIFYRGGWCPYCNAHLAEVGKAEDSILALGYRVIAISPDAPEYLKETLEKQELKYTLLSDSKGELANAVGISYKAPAIKTGQLSKRSGGDNDGFLPVPSLFVVNKKGDIIFEYINPDYTTRISSKLLLAVLKALGE